MSSQGLWASNQGCPTVSAWKRSASKSGNNWCHRGAFARQQVLLRSEGKTKAVARRLQLFSPHPLLLYGKGSLVYVGVSVCQGGCFWVSISTDIACHELLPEGGKNQESSFRLCLFCLLMNLPDLWFTLAYFRLHWGHRGKSQRWMWWKSYYSLFLSTGSLKYCSTCRMLCA